MTVRGRPGVLALGLAAAAGILQAFSIAWPGSGQPLWWLQLLSLAGLAVLLRRAPGARSAALRGWVFATAWLAATFWWLFISMHVYGGLPSWMAATGVLGLAAFLALYYGLAAGVFRALASGRPLLDALLFAAVWLGAELLRATWFTGFPWGASGYAHVDGPLAALAPWVGVYGIGAVAAAFAHACSHAALLRSSRRHWIALLAAAGLLAACNVIDRPSGEATGRLRVALLQGNIPQDEKFEGGSGIPVALEWYGRQLRESAADLVVAPETALPLLPSQLPDGYLEALRRQYATGERAALLGLPLGGMEEGYTNSVIGLKPGAAEYRYDKHHLVPFGEFIPPLFKWFTRMMNIPLGDFDRGGVGQASLEWRGQRLAPNICYEDLFGEELAARFRDPAAAPTVFVNVSNIAWFGDSIAIDQHLHISRMRALEFRRPVIRATNTGATAVIDSAGRVTHELARHTRGVLLAEVEGASGLTPFARWAAAWGLWPLWALALGVPAAAWVVRRRRPAPYN